LGPWISASAEHVLRERSWFQKEYRQSRFRSTASRASASRCRHSPNAEATFRFSFSVSAERTFIRRDAGARRARTRTAVSLRLAAQRARDGFAVEATARSIIAGRLRPWFPSTSILLDPP
jgi:hypothetical protein